MIHVVLFEPEIPQNTGNIVRTCAAFHATLHLIHPLGFIFSQKEFRRSMMDYDKLVTIIEHDDLESFLTSVNGRIYYITRYGQHTPDQVDLRADNQDIYLMFGKESTGLPLALLAQHQEDCIRIPMAPNARSMNVSNTVAIVLYEAIKQNDYIGCSKMEVLKGADWLDKHKP